MARITKTGRIQQKIDKKSVWEENNPKILAGEMCITTSDDEDDPHVKIKIASKDSNWSDIPYFGGGSSGESLWTEKGSGSLTPVSQSAMILEGKNSIGVGGTGYSSANYSALIGNSDQSILSIDLTLTSATDTSYTYEITSPTSSDTLDLLAGRSVPIETFDSIKLGTVYGGDTYTIVSEEDLLDGETSGSLRIVGGISGGDNLLSVGNTNLVVSSNRGLVSGSNNIVIGATNSEVSGTTNTVILSSASYVGGYDNTLKSSTNSIVFGEKNVVTSSEIASVFGRANTVNAHASFVEGYGNYLGATKTYDSSTGKSTFTPIKVNESHVEGYMNAVGSDAAHAEGSNTYAAGIYSHTEGGGTTATAQAAHAEGGGTLASGICSHAEGGGSIAYGLNSHAEGGGSIAYGLDSHAESKYTNAVGDYSHSEGRDTGAYSAYAHSEGYLTSALGTASHSGGMGKSLSGALTILESNGTTYECTLDLTVDNMLVSKMLYDSGNKSGIMFFGYESSAYTEYGPAYDASSGAIQELASNLVCTLSSITYDGSDYILTVVVNDGNEYSGSIPFKNMTFYGAIGDFSSTSGLYSIALGDGSQAGGYKSKVLGNYSFAIGANNYVGSSYSAILSGTSNSIESNSPNSAIMGGNGNIIASGVSNAVIIGGDGITATLGDMVYVPNIEFVNVTETVIDSIFSES